MPDDLVDRYRDMQARVFEEIGKKLDDIAGQTTAIARDSKENGERLARIEGLQVGNDREIVGLKGELKDARDEIKDSREKNTALESRIIRLETMIVPGMSLVAAVASAVVGHLIH